MKKKYDGSEDISWVDVELKEEDVNQLLFRYLFGYLIVYFGTLGTIMLVTTGLHFEIYNSLLIFGMLVVCIIPCVAYYAKARRFMAYMIVAGVFFVFVAIFSRQIIVSAILSINRIIEEISKPYDLSLGSLAVPNLGVGNINMGLFIFLCAFIISMIVGYTVIVKHSLIVSMIVPVSLIVFLLSFDVIPSTGALMLVMMYFLAILALSNGPKLSPNPIVPMLISSIIIVLFILVTVFVPKARYVRPLIFDNLQLWAQNTFTQLVRYDSDLISIDEKSQGGINGGNLGQTDSIEYKNQTMFMLTTAKSGKCQYYRSFYGTVYNNNSWKELSEEESTKYEVLFSKLSNLDVDTNIQTSILMRILKNNQILQNNLKTTTFNFTEDVGKREFSVFYYGADKNYWYLPYASEKSIEQKSSDDGYPQNNSNGYCVGNYYMIQDMDYSQIKKIVDSYSGTSTEMISYKNWESEYRKYVYDVYTMMPSINVDMKTMADKYSVTTETGKKAYVDAVIQYLADNYSYTLSPGKVPEGKDFVDYFLNESKEGYCTYFATTATLMFRAAGIPARYVEGYCVTDESIAQGEMSKGYLYSQTAVESTYDKYTIPVLDNNAHAWVEIYEDGYGWIPIEVTPGVEYSTDQFAKAQASQNNVTQTESATEESSEEASEKSSDIVENVNDKDSADGLNGIGFGVWNFMKNINVPVVIASILVLGLLGIVIGWYISYIKARKRVELLLSMEIGFNHKKQVFMIYRYIIRICKFLKMEKPVSMDYEKYSEYLKENAEYFADCNINDIMEIVLRARFSNSEPLENETRFVTEEANKLRESTYSKLTRADKIRFKYFSKL